MEKKSYLEIGVFTFIMVFHYLGFLAGIALMAGKIFGFELGIPWWGYLIISLVIGIQGFIWMSVRDTIRNMAEKIRKLEDKLK